MMNYRSGRLERLQLRSRRRKLACRTHRLELNLLVRAVAKWLVFRLTAAAQRNLVSSGQIKSVARGVVNREVSLDQNRAIVTNRNLRCHSTDPSSTAARMFRKLVGAFGLS